MEGHSRYMMIGKDKALLSWIGAPDLCRGCRGEGHAQSVCPLSKPAFFIKDRPTKPEGASTSLPPRSQNSVPTHLDPTSSQEEADAAAPQQSLPTRRKRLRSNSGPVRERPVG